MARVVSVSARSEHSISKHAVDSIRLIAGLGVEGDAHAGATVQHRSRVRRDPSQPNLRQVHLIHVELLEQLARQGFPVGMGEMGENITTQGIELLALPAGTRLHLGDDAVVEVTGLRNPCVQLDCLHQGLMQAVLECDAAGRLVRKAGVMGIVLTGGTVRPGDAITVVEPEPPHRGLEAV